MTTKKVLCIVLDSDPHESWRETYDCHRRFWNLTFDACPWVEGYFIRADPSLGAEFEIKSRQFTIRAEESYGGLLNKTLRALEKLLSDQEYVVRTNVTSLYDFKLLIQEPIKERTYAGCLVNGEYVTGSGILMSNDTARALIEPFGFRVSEWDDKAIYQILTLKGITPQSRGAFIKAGQILSRKRQKRSRYCNMRDCASDSRHYRPTLR